MQGFNLWAMAVSVITVFALSSAYYAAFSRQRAQLSGASAEELSKPEPWKVGVELVRNVVLTFVLAYLVEHLRLDGWVQGLHLGVLLWIGFPFILLSGSMMWEHVPFKLAALHSGDWLIKLVFITWLLTIWR